MTYVLVTEEGKAEARPGTPSPEELIRLLGGGVPELIRTRDPELSLWVNDDFQGVFTRNVVATVMAVIAGTYPRPISGPVVFTDLRYTPLDGYTPDGLAPYVEMALLSALTDIRAVVLGEGEPENPDYLDAEIRSTMLQIAEMARTAEHPQMEVRVISVTDFLRSLGVEQDHQEGR